jgi:hypothetical protein
MAKRASNADKVKKKIDKFDLETSVMGGPIAIDKPGFLELDEVNLSANQEDYLIHVQYLKKEGIYVYHVYSEKK